MKQVEKGKFIVVEGPDGCGKSTQIKKLYQYIKEELQQPVVLTKEPGGTAISNKIRAILLDPDNEALKDKTELLLYAASRAQHVEEFIKPQLASGRHVLCDRFVDSTIAYQGFGRGLDMQLIKQLNQIATDGLTSDISICIMVRTEEALQRIAAKREFDRLEQNEVAFHQKTYEGYQQLLKEDSSKIYIDGAGDEHEVFQRIKAQITHLLEER